MTASRAAGAALKTGQETTSGCLHLDERPSTPEKVQKWRRSKYAEPGQRVIHPGLQDDYQGRSTSVDRTGYRFGKIKVESDHVEDIWSQPGAESDYAAAKNSQRESVYQSAKREPLGKSYIRGHKLPVDIFGKSADGGTTDAAKMLIYAKETPETTSGKELYVKSHGSYDPGEQKTRNYDWKGKDLMTHRFGVGVGSHVAFNGMAPGAAAALSDTKVACAVTSTRVQNFKRLQDKLGKPRHLGHARQVSKSHVFGNKSVRGEGDWDARQCIQGNYPPEDFDSDLGTTHTPGFRNCNSDRTFGVPTIRSDIPKYSKRSVADTQNYGDDANAQVLLHPSLLTSMGLDENELDSQRSKDDILDIFTKAKPHLSKANIDFDECFQRASNGSSTTSLGAFRKAIIDGA